MVLLLYRWMYPALFLLFSARESNFRVCNHPLYISVTEINFNAGEKLVEISCKIFTDDFENVLTKFSNTKIHLSDEKNKPATDKIIADYISRHLHLKIDGKPVGLQYVGSENEAEATWSYFQVNNIGSLKNIDVMNDLLYESYNTEINIIHVVVNGKRQSTKLENPEVNTRFDF